MEKLRVAVVGHGFLGKWHVEKSIKCQEEGLCKLVGVVESNEEVKNKLVVQYPQLMIKSSLQEMLPLADVFFVIVPTSLHFKMVKEILSQGKHCFCEKPMTQTLPEAMELREIVFKSTGNFQVGHSERYHLIWQELLSSKMNRYLGTKSTVSFKRVAPFKGRATDVDVMSDLMIHDIDLMLHLFNEWPIEVSATGYKIRTSTYDYVEAIWKFASGRIVTISSGRNNVKEERTFDIISSEGHLQVDMHNCMIRLFDKTSPAVFEQSYQKRDHLLEEHREFYKAIINKRAPLIGAEDGFRAINLIEKVRESLQTQKSVSINKL